MDYIEKTIKNLEMGTGGGEDLKVAIESLKKQQKLKGNIKYYKSLKPFQEVLAYEVVEVLEGCEVCDYD